MKSNIGKNKCVLLWL